MFVDRRKAQNIPTWAARHPSWGREVADVFVHWSQTPMQINSIQSLSTPHVKINFEGRVASNLHEPSESALLLTTCFYYISPGGTGLLRERCLALWAPPILPKMKSTVKYIITEKLLFKAILTPKLASTPIISVSGTPFLTYWPLTGGQHWTYGLVWSTLVDPNFIDHRPILVASQSRDDKQQRWHRTLVATW